VIDEKSPTTRSSTARCERCSGVNKVRFGSGIREPSMRMSLTTSGNDSAVIGLSGPVAWATVCLHWMGKYSGTKLYHDTEARLSAFFPWFTACSSLSSVPSTSSTRVIAWVSSGHVQRAGPLAGGSDAITQWRMTVVDLGLGLAQFLLDFLLDDLGYVRRHDKPPEAYSDKMACLPNW
jgi:hypothetical protein